MASKLAQLRAQRDAKAKASADWKLDAFANAPKASKTVTPDTEPVQEPEVAFATDEHRARQWQRLQMALRLTGQ